MAGSKKFSVRKALAVVGALVIVALGVKYFFFRGKFLYAGTLEGTKVDLSSRLSSAIKAVNVREGDHVKASELLASLDCEDYLASADLAHTNYGRNLAMYKGGTVTKEALDQLKNKKVQADIDVSWCTIDSPIDGTVLSRYREPGEWVTPGTRLLTLSNIKDIWAYIYVPQPKVANLKPGQKLKAYLPELNNKEFTGTILKINDEAEFTPKNVQTRAERERLVFGVKVSFLGYNDEEVLKPGMTVEVELPE
jgi:HlyD family secretion protein